MYISNNQEHRIDKLIGNYFRDYELSTPGNLNAETLIAQSPVVAESGSIYVNEDAAKLYMIAGQNIYEYDLNP